MTLDELCFHLRHRRPRSLLDDRYATAVAFVHGFDAALDGAPLTGFQDHVAHHLFGRRSPVHWSHLIPRALGHPGPEEVPPEAQAVLTNTMLDLLESFSDRPR